MYISLFVEIDDCKKPLYYEEYKRTYEGGGVVMATREYVEDACDADRVWVIPDEIIKVVDDFIEKPENRAELLQIKRCVQLEEWMEEKIGHGNKYIEGIISNKNYISVQEVANTMKIEWLVQMGSRYTTQAKNNSEYLISELKTQLLEMENAKKSLEGYIRSTENYMRELQIHATKLDEEVKKYKTFYDTHEENSDYVKQIREQNEKYAEKYKELILELDKLKTEKLNSMV